MTIDRPDGRAPSDRAPSSASPPSPPSTSSVLAALGWDEARRRGAPPGPPGSEPARVTSEHGALWRVVGAGGERLADVTGALRHRARERSELPATGDWVTIVDRPAEGRATIHALHPRRSRLARAQPGGMGAHQVLAANVDVVFVVTALNRDLNPRRVERYLTAVWEGGAQPVVVLSKADLCPPDLAAEARDALRSVSPGVEVLVTAALEGAGVDLLRARLGPGRTAVLVGSSGVGKSTLVNALLGDERQSTGAAREADDRGRHTTTRRDLFVLEGVGVLIDTPGLRELAPTEGDGLQQTFADLDALARQCRFNDCAHEAEPGCAVQAAIARGEVEEARLAAWHKLARELAHEARRHDKFLQREQARRWRKLGAQGAERSKEKRRGGW